MTGGGFGAGAACDDRRGRENGDRAPSDETMGASPRPDARLRTAVTTKARARFIVAVVTYDRPTITNRRHPSPGFVGV